MIKKCVHCGLKSVPGLKTGLALCKYHWNVYLHGTKWANNARKLEQALKRLESEDKASLLRAALKDLSKGRYKK